jgi:cation transport regulator ChaB
MRRLLSIGLTFVSVSAFAQGRPCTEPEYLFLKSASLPEMRDAYCSLELRAESNDRDRKITKEAIQEKQEMHLDASKERGNEMGELRAVTSCKVAASAVAGAIERRFKSKPPSCS